ncbi:hypothetical protein HQ576_14235, partial [bacterium]|nr:hypothetical protein [bacterium]
IMIAYASYLPRESNIPMDALLTCVGNCLFSVFAGFAVFATIGYLAHTAQVDVAELGKVHKIGGPMLIFVTYPVVLNKITGGAFFGALFFFSLVVAGLSSSISIVEAFTTATLDQFKLPRRVVTSVLCAIGFLGGLVFCTGSGLFALDIVDHFLNRYGLMVVAVLECLIVGWFFSTKRLRAHLDDAAGMRFRGGAGVVMRVLITCVLGITWYGLATAEQQALSGHLVRFFLLAGILIVWLDEHWLDVDIKMVIPGLLLLLLNQAIHTDVTTRYEGYPREALLWLGLGWLGATLAIAFAIDAFFRYRIAKNAVAEASERQMDES